MHGFDRDQPEARREEKLNRHIEENALPVLYGVITTPAQGERLNHVILHRIMGEANDTRYRLTGTIWAKHVKGRIHIVALWRNGADKALGCEDTGDTLS